MAVNYKSSDGRMTVDFSETKHVDLWSAVSKFQEVFEEHKCGKCGGTDHTLEVRTTKEGHKYYDRRCKNDKCKAVLHYGIKNDGSGDLFPKRKDDGEWVGNNGWVIYDHETQTES